VRLVNLCGVTHQVAEVVPAVLDAPAQLLNDQGGTRAAASSCSVVASVFGCTVTEGAAAAPAPAGSGVNPDGSVNPGPTTLQPLPAPVKGGPLFPRVNGHIPFGLNGGQIALPGPIEKGIGGSVHRIPVTWSGVMNSKGQWWWDEIDTYYRSLVQAGVRPIMMLTRTPKEYVESQYRLTSTCGGTLLAPGRSCETPPAPEHVGKWGDFARRVAVRYPLAAGVEIWNEPNLTNWWKGPPPSGTRYTSILKAAWDAIKKPAAADGSGGRPAMRVLGGSINNRMYSNNTGMEDRVFLGEMLSAGAASVMDGLALHPYPYEPSLDGLRLTLSRYEDVLAEYPETADLRYAITEMGFTTGTADASSVKLTEAEQATSLVSLYRFYDTPAPTVPGAARTDLAVIYTIVDPDASGGFGMLKPKGSDGRYPAKPAWCAFRRQVANVATPVPSEVSVPAALAASC
jgi:hypothetical protein